MSRLCRQPRTSTVEVGRHHPLASPELPRWKSVGTIHSPAPNFHGGSRSAPSARQPRTSTVEVGRHHPLASPELPRWKSVGTILLYCTLNKPQ